MAVDLARPLSAEQLHEIGMALATLEAAVMAEPDAFRIAADHAHVIGDAAIFALARRGFVVIGDPAAAAEVASWYERAPEQGSKLLT